MTIALAIENCMAKSEQIVGQQQRQTKAELNDCGGQTVNTEESSADCNSDEFSETKAEFDNSSDKTNSNESDLHSDTGNSSASRGSESSTTTNVDDDLTTTTTSSDAVEADNGDRKYQALDRTAAIKQLSHNSLDKLVATSDDTDSACEATALKSTFVEAFLVEHLATFPTKLQTTKTSNSNDDEKTVYKSSNETFHSQFTQNISNNINNNNSSSEEEERRKSNNAVVSDVASNKQTQSEYSISENFALKRLFELEKVSGIWTQQMKIELQPQKLFVIDSESKTVIESYNFECVTDLQALSYYNEIYNNLLVFTITSATFQGKTIEKTSAEELSSINCESESGEVFIFQCVSHDAKTIVEKIVSWKKQQSSQSKSTLGMEQQRQTTSITSTNTESPPQQQQVTANKTSEEPQKSSGNQKPLIQIQESGNSSSSLNETARQLEQVKSNVNVRETVQAFNQIAALRSTNTCSSSGTSSATASKSASPTQHATPNGHLLDACHSYRQRSIRVSLPPPPPTTTAAAATKLTAAPKNGGASISGAVDESRAAAAARSSRSSASGASSSSATAAAAAAADKSRNEKHSKRSTSAGSTTTTTTTTTATKTAATKTRLVERAPRSADAPHSRRERSSSGARAAPKSQQTTNESYVSVLNHCFDDIEKFIVRLQRSLAAARQLELHKQHAAALLRGVPGGGGGGNSKSNSKLATASNKPSTIAGSGNGSGTMNASLASSANSSLASSSHSSSSSPLTTTTTTTITTSATNTALTAAAFDSKSFAELKSKVAVMTPNADDFYEIFSKFKLAFNLLAKLRACIHEPNAPELVHFLFTPLAIINEAAHNVTPPVDASLVDIPYLNRTAVELLTNCCTSHESDLWRSLGSSWTSPVRASRLAAARLPSSFQPIFSDGWAPLISDLDLIGLAPPAPIDAHYQRAPRSHYLPQSARYVELNAGDGDYDDYDDYGYEDGAAAVVEQSRRRRPSQPNGAAYASTHLLAADDDYGVDEHCSPDRDYRRGEPSLLMRAPTSMSRERKLQLRNKHRYVESSQPFAAAPAADDDNYGDAYVINDDDGGVGIVDDEDAAAHRRRRPTRSDYFAASEMRAARLPPTQHAAAAYNYSSHHNYSGDKHSARGSHSTRNYSTATSLYNDDYAAEYDYGKLASSAGSRRSSAPPPPRRSSAMAGTKDLRHAAPPRQQLQRPTSQRRSTTNLNLQQQQPLMNRDSASIDSDYEAILVDLGPAQAGWLGALQARNARTVRALFARAANNEKELSVRKGEILELINDRRRWWRVANIDMQVGHVPHTIVAEMHGYQSLDELLALAGSSDSYDDGGWYRDASAPQHRIADVDAAGGRQRGGQPETRANAFRFY